MSKIIQWITRAWKDIRRRRRLAKIKITPEMHAYMDKLGRLLRADLDAWVAKGCPPLTTKEQEAAIQARGLRVSDPPKPKFGSGVSKQK